MSPRGATAAWPLTFLRILLCSWPLVYILYSINMRSDIFTLQSQVWKWVPQWELKIVVRDSVTQAAVVVQKSGVTACYVHVSVLLFLVHVMDIRVNAFDSSGFYLSGEMQQRH